MLTQEALRDAVVELLMRAETSLPGDVEKALKEARIKETAGIAKTQLDAILENVACARKDRVPICQDTGLPVFYVSIGTKAGICLDIKKAIASGLKKATKDLPLRPNTVHPLTRANPGDNTGEGMPIVETEVLAGKDYVEITVLPKGAGSENMSALKMLGPSEGKAGVRRFVLETVASAGGNPCPPTIIGVGLGGTADHAMKLSKKALLRRLDARNADKDMADLEGKLLSDINGLGIGPMGLGGRATSLAVNIEYSYCHTASLPVAVSIQCWASRRASVRIRAGSIEFR